MSETHPYRDECFWRERIRDENIWRGIFAPDQKTLTPLFICSIKAGPEGDIGCDWVSYPSCHAALGFLQHVYLPAVFCSAALPSCPGLCTAAQSVDEILLRSGDARANLMLHFLDMAEDMWCVCDDCLPRVMVEFCVAFSRVWGRMPQPAGLNLFFSAPAIGCRMRKEYWCEEVFVEETGMNLKSFDALCDAAQSSVVYRGLLINFLNNTPLILA